MLSSWRAWALYESEGCTAGLATISDCYGEGEDPRHTLNGNLPALSLGGSVGTIAVDLGEQIFEWAGSPSDNLYASDFDAEVGDDAWLARFGLYMHFLQDRVSHNICSDDPDTETSGPDASGNYAVVYDNVECNAPIHALRHAWEVGYYDPSRLSHREETTEQALRVTYRELLWFADTHGVLPQSVPTEDALVADLLEVMQTLDPIARVEAMDDVSSTWGVEPMPY